MRRGMRERAKAVEGAMGEVVGMCEACLAEVFQVEGGAKQGGGQGGGGGEGELEGERPAGGDGVFWESQGEILKKREPPVVKAFERLSLLG